MNFDRSGLPMKLDRQFVVDELKKQGESANAQKALDELHQLEPSSDAGARPDPANHGWRARCAGPVVSAAPGPLLVPSSYVPLDLRARARIPGPSRPHVSRPVGRGAKLSGKGALDLLVGHQGL